MKARPYGLVTIRLSKITMMPRSVLVRIRRPTPCRSFKIASGNEIRERVTTNAFLNELQLRFNKRCVRHPAKRQAGDDDVEKRFPGNIDPAPETVRPKKERCAASI